MTDVRTGAPTGRSGSPEDPPPPGSFAAGAQDPADPPPGSKIEPPGKAAEVAARVTPIGALVMAGNQEEALALALPMLDDLDPERDRHERILVLGWIAPAYADMGRVEESLATCDEIVELAGDVPSGSLGSALCIRGVIRTRMRDETAGLADLRTAAALVNRPGIAPEDVFGILVVLASSSSNIGLYEASEALFAASAPMVEAAPPIARAYHTESWAWSHAEWGVTLGQEGDAEGARSHLERVGELTQRIRTDAEQVLDESAGAPEGTVPPVGEDTMTVNADTLLALVAAWMGRPRDALAILDGLSEEPATRTRNDPALAAALARALAERDLGDPDAAIEHAKRAASVADRARSERWQAEAHRVLGEAARTVGDARLESAAAERYEALLDDLPWQLRLRTVQLSSIAR